MCELCDLDVIKAAPFARRHLLKLTATADVLVVWKLDRLTRSLSENELLIDVNFKLMRSIGRFDPTKGSAFSFVSAVITSTLQTSVTNTRKNWLRHFELSDEVANTLHAKAH